MLIFAIRTSAKKVKVLQPFQIIALCQSKQIPFYEVEDTKLQKAF